MCPIIVQQSCLIVCDKFVFSNDFSSAHTFDFFIFTLVDSRRKKIFLAISVAIFGYTIYLLIDNLPYCIVYPNFLSNKKTFFVRVFALN